MTDLWYLNTKKISEEDMKSLSALLPVVMTNEIMRFRNHEDRRLKLLGKLMVKKYYTDLGIAFSWQGWQLTPKGKPFYEGIKKFNISHSGEYVAVAFSDLQIGIDMEKVTDLDVKTISTYFHPEEAGYIENSTDPNDAFFKLWTRKEAYLKATGKGILEGLHNENCLPGKLEDAGTWYFHSLSLVPGYQAAVCTPDPDPQIHVRELFPLEFNVAMFSLNADFRK